MSTKGSSWIFPGVLICTCLRRNILATNWGKEPAKGIKIPRVPTWMEMEPVVQAKVDLLRL
jgi:hypothetical protein